ncbi:hypothetical protein Bca4012_016100 [Brassica carinata]
MDRYGRRNTEDLVVPNYHETSDSYPSPDMWDGWSMNSHKAAEKCFDFDVINNGFSGGLYSQMEMGTSGEGEEESKRLKTAGCFHNSVSSLHPFDEIQQMDEDDIFLSSILEDVPDDNGEVSMFHYNRETCHDMPLMEEEVPMKISDLWEYCKDEISTEVVLQDLQRATEKLTDDTRKCFRDTFYRLAKNSQHKSESEFLEDRTRYINQQTEMETNSIDRAVANLTFNKMGSNMTNMHPPNMR